MNKTDISEREFAKICREINDERDIICKHNPIGSEEETLLWMLMSVLISYLSLDSAEIPCLTGIPTAATYQHAILFILKDRRTNDFDPEPYLESWSALNSKELK